jgi:vanillate O-demethylase ferredoxin subunit
MTADVSELTLQVRETRALNPLIRLIELVDPMGGALPVWSVGSHIQVQVTLPDGSRDWRHYSLIDLAGSAHQSEPPSAYTIAVRREAPGRGGSGFMHDGLHAGDRIAVKPPKNDFPLKHVGGATVLLAGGIGITPLTGMAAYCRANGRAVRLHYAGRSRALMAFSDELQALLGDDLHIHADDEQSGAALDLAAVFQGCDAQDHVYVCGPKPMLDAALAAAKAQHWPPERVHFELFTTDVQTGGDQAFEVVLSQSGQTLTVPADQTLLDCLIEHGCDPMYDCKRGECGVCTTAVLEGGIDHRDYVLTETEKATGKMMQICVSRAKGSRIVLDM